MTQDTTQDTTQDRKEEGDGESKEVQTYNLNI